MIYFVLYLFLEIMVSSTISSALGGLLTFVEVIVSALIGIFLLQNFKYALMENMMDLARGNINQQDFMRLNIFMALGAVLLIIPGFLTDIIGILLQFEFFGLLMAKKFIKRGSSKKNDDPFQNTDFRNQNKKDDDVIDVEIIDDSRGIK